MTHKRTEIRNAIVSLISGGSTDAGSNVFNSPSSPRFQASLPCVVVFLKDEEPGDKTAGPNPIQIRTAICEIQIGAEATTDAAAITTAEDICKQVEDLVETENIQQANTLGEKVTDIQFDGIRYSTSNQGEKYVATLALRYRMTYLVKYTTS